MGYKIKRGKKGIRMKGIKKKKRKRTRTEKVTDGQEDGD
jgi:hypothetical protein